jgi:hypothetical protein
MSRLSDFIREHSEEILAEWETFARGEVTTAAQWHGAGRAESGFTVGHMVSEFRALRATVVRLWTRQQREAGAKARFPPRGLLTFAALMPSQWEFELIAPRSCARIPLRTVWRAAAVPLSDWLPCRCPDARSEGRSRRGRALLLYPLLAGQ